MQTNETRTVTQFHFLTWLNQNVPETSRTLLDFRSDGEQCELNPTLQEGPQTHRTILFWTAEDEEGPGGQIEEGLLELSTRDPRR
ncbi:Receptor-type tyrosine-protein phosphatase N2 [Liparis tanakae]|uniref:Receptor-type tyrosine-protein phosphatase N2 n=1 Tax=Liparis tanakae TaxID=230148 RepID=A0A4Z2E8R4_9TELE|nr:Receptor-type tyrosine-protein phosphatase N2 [Liparis tanakae]